MSTVRFLIILCAATGFGSAIDRPLAPAAEPSWEITASSFIGAKDADDAVVAARIGDGGEIMLFSNSERRDAAEEGDSRFTFTVLSPDGSSRLGSGGGVGRVADVADCEPGWIVGAGPEGLATAALADDTPPAEIWEKTGIDCRRVDAAEDGTVAVLADEKVLIFDRDGNEIGQTPQHHFACDVCVDAKSKTVVVCGFRNAHAFDGKKTYPVQICYIHGLAYDGSRKWTNYDWSTDRDSDRFLNKPTNNMADTRADRCTIGRDGHLYVTFQVAGGNHIFRYSPKDIMEKSPIVGGDKHHEFYNSQSEHKCFFARYRPSDGTYLAGQQLCGRLSSGRANAVVTKDGDITADEAGRVYLVGRSASGLPVSMNPAGADYLGGGFLLVMSSDLKERLLCLIVQGGKCSPHTVDVRTIDGSTRIAFGGSGATDGMYVKNSPLDAWADGFDRGTEKGDPKDGFYVVLKEVKAE